MFATGHDPFASCLSCFNLTSTDTCVCGELGSFCVMPIPARLLPHFISENQHWNMKLLGEREFWLTTCLERKSDYSGDSFASMKCSSAETSKCCCHFLKLNDYLH
ncbi:hypothetical protein AVEN_169288-1 [Araneus ventricosus]|uniref:Uncharacterized protein n=1 Tax=Araneus ventricosus TaxID=182803 RepID=A0A4Y2NRZ9_ARAVE|nr:hypothetical protein AVEN_169288-1 [Araneus ventricosus]